MVVAFAIAGLLTYLNFVGFSTPVAFGTPQPTWDGADNATLGFGGIFVLTQNTRTWRVQGLRKAAGLVGLDLAVSPQNSKSDKDVEDYLQGDKLAVHISAVKATLNYISLLQQFLQTGYDTALFVEDDIDFSINVKSQMSLLADAVSGKDEKSRNPSDPYNYADWDVLWIGHFGIEFTEQTHISHYKDPHALPWAALKSDFNNYYEQQKAAESNSGSTTQQLIRQIAPLSSYAWAITRTHAKWLVEELTKTRAQEFDVQLHILCRGLRQRCIAPVPELMHHHRVTGSESISQFKAEAAGDSSVTHDSKVLSWWQRMFSDDEGLDWWRNATKYTYNVEWSARCNAGESGDRLNDKWQCLPKDDDAEI